MNISTLPKVLLHDHLDGGLRPATVIELANEYGYNKLPTTDVDDLAAWFNARRQAQRPGVVPRDVRPHRRRHAAPRRDRTGRRSNAPQDLAADGVVYAEVRMAPELCTEAGLTHDEAVAAMLDGFRKGSDGTDLTIYLICSAMRTAARSREIAELAVRWRDAGVVGFDIAGAEEGYPPTHHLDAFDYVRRENFHTTIHAGEAFGLPSIWEAVQFCGAERLGHGVRIVDDITGPPGEEELGRLAAFVRDRRIPLELCPTSNLGTGVCKTIAEHPIGMLRRLRFRVTVNTDNRLMSATSMTLRDASSLPTAFGWGIDDFEWLTINAMKSAFAAVPRAAADHQRDRQAALRAGPRRAERRSQLDRRLQSRVHGPRSTC